VNTTANATLVSVTNSTSSANVDAISFKTGLFTGNTISVSVSNSTGYSVFANTDTIKVGNSTVNTMIVSNSTTSFIDTDGYVRILGNTDIANTLLVVGNTSLSNTLAVTGATTLSNTLAVTGAATLSNTLSVTGAANTLSTLGVGGAANLASTLGVIGATALSNTLAITGNTTLANTLAVTGAATLSSTLALTGAATLSNTIAVTGTASYANIVTFKTEHVIDVFANGNLGATVGSDLLVFQFPKADYSSVKLLIQLKNAGNTQISEALIAHDTTDAYLTTYGTVSAPPTANAGLSLLGNFSANADTTNVRVYVNQKIASTAAKVVAQFIK
jgi:hypothetical protein